MSARDKQMAAESFGMAFNPARLRALKKGREAAGLRQTEIADRHFYQALECSRTFAEILDVGYNAAKFRTFKTACRAFILAAKHARHAGAAMAVLEGAEAFCLRAAAHAAFRRAVELAINPRDLQRLLASQTARSSIHAASYAQSKLAACNRSGIRDREVMRVIVQGAPDPRLGFAAI